MLTNIKDIFHSFLIKNKYPLILVAVILLCLWPLSFFIFIPKWDNINGYLPYRYFISDYIWNGHLPLWNPFQRLGYPGYSDLQSGCWNPITWLIMLFGKYTIGSLIVELLSYYVIAGLGMHKLGNYFYKNPKTSFIIALCYALSGFMVGSSQLMVFLVGVAWLPWCIYGILNFLTNFKIKYAVLTSLFIALCTSAVSPAYSIVLAYIFVFIFMYFLWKNRGEYENVKKILNGGVIILVTSILLLLPYINSFIEFAPYFNRIDKLEYDGFLFSNPFIFVDYISFIFPYTVISSTDIFNQTDISLRNGYFGIIGLIFFITAIFTVKNKYYKVLIGVFVASLILAAGSETFIYKWVYNLPGFGVFRHPSFFRTYAIFSALLLAGFALKKAITTNKLSKLETRLILAFIGVLVGVVIYSFFKTSIPEITENLSNVFVHQEFSNHSIYTHLFVNSFGLLLLVFLSFFLKKIFKMSLFISLAIFVILDLGLQTRLAGATTLHFNFSYDSFAEYFDGLPKEINQDNNRPLKYFDETQGLKSVQGIWRNVSTFNKTLSYVGENPMRFKSFDEGREDGGLEKIIENELFYFPTKQLMEGDTLQKGLVWGVNIDNEIISENKIIESVVVGYNEFDAHVKNLNKTDQWLILNQNYHHLWQAEYNKKPLPITKINEMVMGVRIPKNSYGEIHFMYKSPKTIYLFIISIISYLTLLGFLIIQEARRHK